MTIAQAERDIERFHERFESVEREIGKSIVGNADIIESILTCLLVDGHALLEGIPGLGKTSLVSAIGQAVHLSFSRVQFTPDLLPGDVLGTHVVHETPEGDRTLVFQPGPLFANLVLADEINRATPKTQSALLEAMQEKTITVGRTTHLLDPPFLVLATQNPLEMEGTYPLPEAQLDRFLFKLRIEYPSDEELHTILDRTTVVDTPQLEAVLDSDQILEMRSTVLSVPVARPVQQYAISLARATQPQDERGVEAAKRWVRFGSSPRGIQAMILTAKVHALRRERPYVACEDIRAVAMPALRHRILLNFEGEAERVDPDDVVRAAIEGTPEPAE